jgi:hypothetical protein
MVLPSSGAIDLASIQTEFGGVNPISINEYYRNGSYVTSNNTNVPTSGQISFANFYGGIAEIIVTISSTSTNVNASTLFGSYWTQNVPKRLVISSGVTVGATNTSNYALSLPSGFSNTVRVVNNGSIQGAGGAANSGTGGNAIFAGAAGILIDNQGTIYSGGGGGGAGGTGGTGGQGYYTVGYDCSYVQSLGNPGSSCTSSCVDPSVVCDYWYGSGAYCVSGGYCDGRDGECYLTIGCDNCGRYISQTCYYNVYTSGGGGGAGGAGGRGRGYDGALAAGSAGSGGAAGGTNAGSGGTGGTGGTGGDWGTSGGTGNTGGTGANGNYTGGSGGSAGSGGGLAGYYIVNNGNVTWVATGTRAGRVG